MPTALDDFTYERIKLLCKEGDALAKQKDYVSALHKYREALALVPEPATIWEAATWIFTAIGDACFLSGNMDEAYGAFSSATHCPGGIGNPFVHFRLGQVQLALGNEIVALDELTRAYMGAGKDIFEGEDPKYFDLVRRNLKEPPSGW
jgi:tetratricopeptide (TPR) repeat protein